MWPESPSNPLLAVADLRAICSATRKPSALLAVDNTFETSLNQQPLDLGADISFQSATKFIGGHSDLLAWVVTVRRDDLRASLRRSRELNGATPGALESFLAVRGARTMALRLQRVQSKSGSITVLDAHIYFDEGQSGSSRARPGFEALKKAAEAKPFDAILVDEPDDEREGSALRQDEAGRSPEGGVSRSRAARDAHHRRRRRVDRRPHPRRPDAGGDPDQCGSLLGHVSSLQAGKP
jgi:hypothetical protein